MDRTKTVFAVIIIILIGTGIFVINHKNQEPSAPVTDDTAQKNLSPETKQQAEKKPETEPEKSDENKRPDQDEKKATPENQPEKADDTKEQAETGVDPNTPPEQKLESVNLNNVEMKQIIKTIAEWTGKPVIPYDDGVMNQKITIYATEQLPRAQVLSLIYSALRTKGYAPEESQGAIYLKPLSKVKYGVVPTLGADEPLAKIIDKSQIVEKFFKIKNYTPSKLQEIVIPLTAEYGHVTADDSTGTLAIIDTVENLQRIEQIIRQFDIAEYGQFKTEVFKLKSGDPTEIVQLINLILGNQKQGRADRNGSRSATSGQSNTEATSVLITSQNTPLLLIPEQRRKWIIAKGAPEDIKEVAKWVDELDKKEEVKSEQTVVQIKYVDVSEVAQAVNRTLAEMPGSQLKANIVVQPLRQARQIVVFGSEENRKIVESLIAEIDMPKESHFVNETFKLKYADPDLLKERIDELYDKRQLTYSYQTSYSSSRQYRYNSDADEELVKVVADSVLNQITVYASEDNMEKIRAQIIEWDVPLSFERQPYRIVSLQNSDSKQMADLLSKLFSEQSESNTDILDYLYGYSRNNSENKKKIVGNLYGQLSFEPVPETKKIIVISKVPEAYDVIEELIKQLDRQEVAEVPKVITLKYADSEDLCDQLNAILNEPGTVATVRRTTRGLSAYNNNASDTDNNNQNNSRSNNINNASNNNTNEIKPWWNAGAARSKADESLPTSNLIGKVRFIPVQRSKALLVLAPPEYMDDMIMMIEELDQPGKQVMIKAVILSVDHSSVTSLGVEFSTNSAAFGDLTENSITALTQLATGIEEGSFTLSASSNINTLIEFLEKHANARILNQPTLWTKDNEEAVFFRGQKVGFVVNSNTSPEGTERRESVDYRPVGVTLRIRPNITPEKAVDTTINLNISQVEPEIINGNIATSDLDTTTHVIVRDGETIMLGGILFQNESDIERKVPLFGDLPILGGLFKHTENTITNNELLMFITPYVIETTSEMNMSDSIPVIKEGFKTLDQAKEFLDKSVMELELSPDSDEENIR